MPSLVVHPGVPRRRAGPRAPVAESPGHGQSAEAHLLARATSDPSERARLVDLYLPRIAAVARPFRSSGLDLADLVQEGALALLEALARYEPGRGVFFWSYARPWVHGAIYRLAQERRRALRLPPAAGMELTQLNEAAQRLARTRGGEQPLEAVAEEAGVEPRRAERIMIASRPLRSLQEGLGPEADGTALGDALPDPRAEEAYDRVEARADAPDLAELMHALSGREREVIARRFGLGRPQETLADIGRRLGVTRERARQIEARALRKLHEAAV
jgi:RNA polymerase primary sigma factor